MKRYSIVLSIIILISSIFTNVYAYGEKIDTLPIWQERAVLVLTNACRMAPTEFRDRFLGNYSILLPENYPPVPPLYWNRELNAASRYHCIEMLLSCGLNHSCNGISVSERVKKFYTNSSRIGENIAVGYKTPQQVVNGWLMDKKNGEPAPDKNGDGHRANIMSPYYKEVGCGYYFPTGVENIQPYWCQDFGGGISSFSYHPVVAASHLFLEKEKITFLVNLYDPKDSVSEVSLILDGAYYPLTLIMGKDTAGTFGTTLALASSCRSYTFKTLFKNNKVLYYPENGSLITYGEGDCNGDDYKPGITYITSSCKHTSPDIKVNIVNDRIVSIVSGNKIPLQTKVFDCQGRLSFSYRWNSKNISIKASNMFSSQAFIFVHRYENGFTQKSKIPLVIYKNR